MAVANPWPRIRALVEHPFAGLLASCATAGLITAGFVSLHEPRQVLDVALLYLALTLLTAATWGYVVGLLVAALCDVLVNYYFIPPVHTFTVGQRSDLFTLLLFLGVAFFAAWMLARLRASVGLLRAQQAENGVLFAVERALAQSTNAGSALDSLATAIAASLHAGRCDIVRESEPAWVVLASTHATSSPLPSAESGALTNAWRTQAFAGQVQFRSLPTSRPAASGGFLIVPFPGDSSVPGAIRLLGALDLPPHVQVDRLLRSVAAEASIAVQRADFAARASEADALRQADEFKGTLLSSLAHDLRSPLMAVKAAVGNLRDESVRWSAADRSDFLETVEAQTDRITAVVSDLLQMNRLETGKVSVHPEAIQVAALLEDAAAAAAPLRGTHLIHVDADESLWLLGDYGLLMQALGNLIDNAPRYSIANSVVRLRAIEHSNEAWIEVQDEGPGIPDEDLPHVFDKLYRGVQARKSTGTGLGLAITKALVELCGGTITAESTYMSNSFRIRLPKAPAP